LQLSDGGRQLSLSINGEAPISTVDMGDLGEFCYYEMPEIGSLIELLDVTEQPPPEEGIG
jgi:hypothetical protein